MPTAPCAGLANRHALALGDAGVGADLAPAWRGRSRSGSSRPHQASGRRPCAAPAARGRDRGLVLALGGGWWWLRGVERGPQTLVGEWSAEVAYPWNLTLREHYVFTLADGRVDGSASFLGVPRALEAVEWGMDALRFLTRSETVSGNEPPREMGQLYEVWREGETLRVRLQIRRSHSVDAPLEFVAQRR